MKKCEGQVVWITGSSSGIGRALALAFAREGAKVALSARRVERLYQVQHEIEQNRGVASVYPLDVCDAKAVSSVCQKIVSDWGKLDTVVANAGYSVVLPFQQITEEIIRKQMEVNFFGVIWTLKEALPHILETKGRLVIMGSIAGKLALKNASAYSASKFALMGLSNSLYQEVAPSGASVTILLPGLIDSEIAQVDALGRFHESHVDKRPSRLRWKTAQAASAMLKAIQKRKREAIITGHAKVANFLICHFSSLIYWALAKMNIKAHH